MHWHRCSLLAVLAALCVPLIGHAQIRLRENPRLGVFRILRKEAAVNPESWGTAFLIDRERGLLLTAAHVIKPETLLPGGYIKIGAAILANSEETSVAPILSGVVEAKIVWDASQSVSAGASAAERDRHDWALLQIDPATFPLLRCFEEIPLDPLIDLNESSVAATPPGLWSPGFPGMDAVAEAMRTRYSTSDVTFKARIIRNGLVEIHSETGGFARGQSGSPVLAADGRLLLIVTQTERVQGQREYSKAIPAWRLFEELATKLPPTERVTRVESFLAKLRAQGITTTTAAQTALRADTNPELWRQYIAVFADMRELRGDEKYHVIRLVAECREPRDFQLLITDYLFGDTLVDCAGLVARLPSAQTLLADAIESFGQPVLLTANEEPTRPSRFIVAVANHLADSDGMDEAVSGGIDRLALTRFMVNCQLAQDQGPMRDGRLAKIAGFAKLGGAAELAYTGIAQAISNRSISKRVRINLIDSAYCLVNYEGAQGGEWEPVTQMVALNTKRLPFHLAKEAEDALQAYELPDLTGLNSDATGKEIRKASLQLKKELGKIEAADLGR